MLRELLRDLTMLTKRIIACLDVSRGRVVKGVQFVDLRDAGDPAELAKAHSRSGADEIVLLDISATHREAEPRCSTTVAPDRSSSCSFPSRVVGAFVRWRMPRRLFGGADKVSINSAASLIH